MDRRPTWSSWSARTGGPGAKGLSLIVLETDGNAGFGRGRNLDKVGLQASDTSELFFDNPVVPPEILLGTEEGQGFFQLMRNSRRSGCRSPSAPPRRWSARSSSRPTTSRPAPPSASRSSQFQTTAFTLAEGKTEATVARVFVNHCLERHLKGELDATTAAMAKYWITDLQCTIVDRSPACSFTAATATWTSIRSARMFKDGRVARIYGGTNEIMKVLIARSL